MTALNVLSISPTPLQEKVMYMYKSGESYLFEYVLTLLLVAYDSLLTAEIGKEVFHLPIKNMVIKPQISGESPQILAHANL